MGSPYMLLLLVLSWTYLIEGLIEPFNPITEPDIPSENIEKIRTYCSSFIIRVTLVISRMFNLQSTSQRVCEEHGFWEGWHHQKNLWGITSRHEEMTSEKIYSYFCHPHQSHQDTQGQRLPNKNPVFCKSSALRQWGCMDVGPVLLWPSSETVIQKKWCSVCSLFSNFFINSFLFLYNFILSLECFQSTKNLQST